MTSTYKDFIRHHAGTALLISALCASLGFNVYQALEIREAFVPRAPEVHAGAKLPLSLSVVDTEGKPASLTFADDSRPTVVYVLSPLCGWCKRNEANIKALVAASGAKFRFVGLSIAAQNLKEYVAEGHAPFPVYLVNSADEIKRLNLGSTPQTLIVNSSGRVEKAWAGAYIEKNRTEVEKFFGVNLPGLEVAESAAPAPVSPQASEGPQGLKSNQ